MEGIDAVVGLIPPGPAAAVDENQEWGGFGSFLRTVEIQQQRTIADFAVLDVSLQLDRSRDRRLHVDDGKQPGFGGDEDGCRDLESGRWSGGRCTEFLQCRSCDGR